MHANSWSHAVLDPLQLFRCLLRSGNYIYAGMLYHITRRDEGGRPADIDRLSSSSTCCIGGRPHVFV